ncbi:DUF695 domain-containing protein [Arthrobacter mobilis]|uniref:DUF695 domain-containing protein n=1 Tax=Arthrobacter mobilis TaxID=2724944 RepID=A0A7X6K2N9_9MICC|nr:DUF695 domain-containing protein [Arthrobacter mobilis]NKX53392.1 DUF695 domain-containing protein [Arthrobacter mobilis]
MAPLGRRKRPQPAAEPAAIRDFWAWWLQHGTRLVAQGRDAGGADYAKQLSRHVSRISPGLAWELGPGTVSTHQLVIFSESKDYAAVARRVLKAAPAPSPEWEYTDVRQASEFFEDLTLGVGGQEFDSTEFRVGLMVNRYSVDIAVYHPRLKDLPAGERLGPVGIMLDHAIGQQDVAAWIGVIEPVLHDLPNGVPLAMLRSVVEQLRSKAFDEQGRPIWHELNGTAANGLPVLARVQVPLVPAFWPDYDLHVVVSLPYKVHLAAGTDAALLQDSGLPDPGGPQDSGLAGGAGLPDGPGLPDAGALAALQAMEDRLCAQLLGEGRLVATETSGGRRLLHFYVDSTGPAAWELEATAVDWQPGQVGFGTELDPAWSSVRHLRIR